MNVKPEASKYLNKDNAANRHRCAIRIMYGKEKLTDVRNCLKRCMPNTNQNVYYFPRLTATWISTNLRLLKNPPAPSIPVRMCQVLRHFEQQ